MQRIWWILVAAIIASSSTSRADEPPPHSTVSGEVGFAMSGEILGERVLSMMGTVARFDAGYDFGRVAVGGVFRLVYAHSYYNLDGPEFAFESRYHVEGVIGPSITVRATRWLRFEAAVLIGMDMESDVDSDGTNYWPSFFATAEASAVFDVARLRRGSMYLRLTGSIGTGHTDTRDGVVDGALTVGYRL